MKKKQGTFKPVTASVSDNFSISSRKIRETEATRSFYSFLLLIAASTVYVLGLVMIYGATSAEMLDRDLARGIAQSLLRQLFYTSIGILLAFGSYTLGVERFIQKSPTLFWVGTLFLLLVFVPGIGKTVNGSHRWIHLGSISFQPSEFMKLITPLYFIHAILPLQKEGFPFKKLCQQGWPFLIPLALVFIEPNHGTAAVMGFLLLLLCWLMGLPAKYWALPLCCALFAGGLVASQHSYVKGRINVFLHPEKDLLGKGHQPYQAKIAAGSGRIWGKGPGNSWQKLSFLPEAQNDYIAAIYAEEYGFIGIAGLLLLYGLLVLSAYALTLSTTNKETFYFSAIVTSLLALHVFLNLGVVSGLLPSTGLNLPLFSQGGSSLMTNLIALGLLCHDQ